MAGAQGLLGEMLSGLGSEGQADVGIAEFGGGSAMYSRKSGEHGEGHGAGGLERSGRSKVRTLSNDVLGMGAGPRKWSIMACPSVVEALPWW